MQVPDAHFVNGTSARAAVSRRASSSDVRMGCFWGAERKFWQLTGVYHDRGRLRGGHTPNPTYREVCTGMTGHTEVVLVVFDPKVIVRRSAADVLGEPRSDAGHAAGQRRRHAVSLRRSTTTTMRSAARPRLTRRVSAATDGGRTTARSRPKSCRAPEFYYAEDYHQQYLAKNPGGYCGLGGTGVSCPVGAGIDA